MTNFKKALSATTMALAIGVTSLSSFASAPEHIVQPAVPLTAATQSIPATLISDTTQVLTKQVASEEIAKGEADTPLAALIQTQYTNEATDLMKSIEMTASTCTTAIKLN